MTGEGFRMGSLQRSMPFEIRSSAMFSMKRSCGMVCAAVVAVSVLGVSMPHDLEAQTTARTTPGRSSATAASRTTSRATAPADSDAIERAWFAAEERGVDASLVADRARYLKQAGWADLGDRCNPGALRVFPKATSSAEQDSVQQLVEHMESRIIGRGVGTKLDTPGASALLRVVVGWEAGIDRPRWDANDKVVRRAVAAGLTGEVPDPRSSKCLPSPLGSDTVTFVVPGFATMEFPKASKPRVKAYFGRDGQQHARDEFYTRRGQVNPTAELSYIVVAPIVTWLDWAVVAVNRPREPGGVVLGGAGNGGATYLLHRVSGEWRLLSIIRSWGG